MEKKYIYMCTQTTKPHITCRVFLEKQKICYFLFKSNTIIQNKSDNVFFDTIFNIYMFKFICTHYEVHRLSRRCDSISLELA